MLEIITEKFDDVTIIEMSQTELPTQQMVQQKIGEVMKQMQSQQQQIQMVSQNPQVQQLAAQQPDMAKQAMEQAQKAQDAAIATINQLKEKPTIEQVLAFLKNNRAKSFVLDIETDSTIQTDENAEKQRRTEFVGMLGTLLPQLAQMIQGEPKTAPFCGEMLKFATAPYRAGRSLDGAVEELVELMKQKGSQPQPDPEAEKLKMLQSIEDKKIEAKKQGDMIDAKNKRDELSMKDRHKQWELENDRRIELAKINAAKGDESYKMLVQSEKRMQNRESHQAHMMEKNQDMVLNQQKAQQASQQASQRATEQSQRAADQRAAQQFKMQQPIGGNGSALMSDWYMGQLAAEGRPFAAAAFPPPAPVWPEPQALTGPERTLSAARGAADKVAAQLPQRRQPCRDQQHGGGGQQGLVPQEPWESGWRWHAREPDWRGARSRSSPSLARMGARRLASAATAARAEAAPLRSIWQASWPFDLSKLQTEELVTASAHASRTVRSGSPSRSSTAAVNSRPRRRGRRAGGAQASTPLTGDCRHDAARRSRA